ncbi:MAG: nitrogenase iron-molybdenum cofactor biosynthesis protein NifN [Nitrospirae bacterium]|nr:nitrogenase iron-molybdenum cofactor biosynthesis protein NifN [Nitrospirota bacterium]
MAATIDKLYEHACEKNTNEGICRARGGESCAFDGAMIVLQCIADAAHLVHGPIACCGNSWESRGTVSDKGILHRRAYTTDMNEIDIVYGAEANLRRAIGETLADSGAKAVFVYSTCVSGLIGEDIDAICREAEASTGCRVIPVHAPGFVGPKNLGNRIAGEVLLDYVIGRSEAAQAPPHSINLIGEYNIAGDLLLVEPVLRRAGINIMARMTGNSTFDEITRAHHAALNVVVCGRALINVAQGMRARHGIPFVEASFFGRSEMSRALRAIGSRFEDISARVEAVIADEEARLAKRLSAYAHLRGKKAVLYTGGVKSWSIISALLDLGMEIVAVGTKKSTFEDEEKMRVILGPDAPLHENVTPAKLRGLMKENSADILIAGGRNQYLAMKEGFAFVDVNQERHAAYAGYDGLVNLAEAISVSIWFFGGKLPPASPPPSMRGARGESFSRSLKGGRGESVSINPLKHSPSIGAAMAMQGIDRAAIVLHGAQGCNFLGKVLLTKHFREPIAMASTKLFVEDVVMGSEERLAKTVAEVAEHNQPDIVAVLTTGLSEVKGDDIGRVLKDTEAPDVKIIHIPTPDYHGGLQDGYAAVVERLAMLAEPVAERNASRVNILAGCFLTPADINELRGMVEAFGLEPIILPDLSALDGSRASFGPLAEGGTTLADIKGMGRSAATLVIGCSLEAAGKKLFERCGAPWFQLPSVTGLAASDRLVALLSELTGREIPARLARQRKILIDGMRDAHSIIGGRRFIIAQEADAAAGMSSLIAEMGAATAMAVVPTGAASAKAIIADEIITGDYGSISGSFDLLIAGSHGRQTAESLGIKHLEIGFPVFGRLGFNSIVTVGYAGTLNMVNMIGNALIGGEA